MFFCICIEFQQASTKNNDVIETFKLEIEKVNLISHNISFVLITFAWIIYIYFDGYNSKVIFLFHHCG